MSIFNKKVKDSVFCDLFGSDINGKKNFLELYNALHGTNLIYEETKIERKIIDQTIYKRYNNDVSMLINGRLIVMYEHQSTINENMPFRFLEYVTRIYEEMYPSGKRYKERMFMIPTPEFFVFYNGEKDYPEEQILKLSNAFVFPVDKPPLELTVVVKNINLDKNLNLQKSCDTLKQYSMLIDLIRKYGKKNNANSYQEVIQLAIEKGILPDYLERKSKEVCNMLIAEYSYETDLKVHMNEAHEEGKIEGKIETAKNMLNDGLAVELVSKYTGISIEELEEIL